MASTHWWFRRKKFYIKQTQKTQPSAQDCQDYTLHTAVNNVDKETWRLGIVWGLGNSGLKAIKQRSTLNVPNWDQPTITSKKTNDRPQPDQLSTDHGKADQCVKDFHQFEYNKGMETRRWVKDDKRRSKDFNQLSRKDYRSEDLSKSGRALLDEEKNIDIQADHQNNWTIFVSTIIGTIPDDPTKTGGSYPNIPSETIVFHNEDGNPARANIKQALGYRKDGDRDGKSEFLRCVKASANSDVKYSFTSAQDGVLLQDDVRLCLGNDLKKAQDHSQRHV
ncbi:hypothetical protein Tco_0968850 [Tanacetum coccineum]